MNTPTNAVVQAICTIMTNLHCQPRRKTGVNIHFSISSNIVLVDWNYDQIEVDVSKCVRLSHKKISYFGTLQSNIIDREY